MAIEILGGGGLHMAFKELNIKAVRTYLVVKSLTTRYGSFLKMILKS